MSTRDYIEGVVPKLGFLDDDKICLTNQFGEVCRTDLTRLDVLGLLTSLTMGCVDVEGAKVEIEISPPGGKRFLKFTLDDGSIALFKEEDFFDLSENI